MPYTVYPKIYVVARNREEFRRWARERRGAPWRFEYLWRPSSVPWLPRGSRYAAVPGWEMHRGMYGLMAQAVRERQWIRVDVLENGNIVYMHDVSSQLAGRIAQTFSVTPEQLGVSGIRQCPCRGCTAIRRDAQQPTAIQGARPTGYIVDEITSTPSVGYVNQLTERLQDRIVSIGEMRDARAPNDGGSPTGYSQSVADANLIMSGDVDWPADSYGFTCAHVCGGDSDHVCDARAVTNITYKLPTGGRRRMPVCGPCCDAELSVLLDEKGR